MLDRKDLAEGYARRFDLKNQKIVKWDEISFYEVDENDSVVKSLIKQGKIRFSHKTKTATNDSGCVFVVY
jgi:hypothetical protein